MENTGERNPYLYKENDRIKEMFSEVFFLVIYTFFSVLGIKKGHWAQQATPAVFLITGFLFTLCTLLSSLCLIHIDFLISQTL
jgi:hypothetical protein